MDMIFPTNRQVIYRTVLTVLTLISCSLVTPAVAQNGVTYRYDAADNRFERRANHIVLGALSNTGVTAVDNASPVVMKDTLLGDALRVRYTEGLCHFDVLLDENLLAGSGSIEILRSTGTEPLLRFDNLEPSRQIDLKEFASGDYIMRICIGETFTVWTVAIV